jgi:hypothetical protein
VREHRRRLTEAAAGARAGDAGRAGVSPAAHTELFRPARPAGANGASAAVPTEAGGAAAPPPPAPADEDAPSWAQPRAGARRRWVVVGTVAAAALLAMPAALRLGLTAPAARDPGAPGAARRGAPAVAAVPAGAGAAPAVAPLSRAAGEVVATPSPDSAGAASAGHSRPPATNEDASAGAAAAAAAPAARRPPRRPPRR